MKIMYAAVFTETSTNTPQARAFEKLNHNLIKFDVTHELDTIQKQKRVENTFEKICQR